MQRVGQKIRGPTHGGHKQGALWTKEGNQLVPRQEGHEKHQWEPDPEGLQGCGLPGGPRSNVEVHLIISPSYLKIGHNSIQTRS